MDHLVELAAGGTSDVRSLWPEPNLLYEATGGAFIRNDKDQVEAYLFHAECAGRVQLASAQQALAANWTTAVATLGLPPIPASYRG